MIFTRCPLCRAINIATPGLPPGNGYNYRNRCQAYALTGKAGHSASYSLYHSELSYWPPARHFSRLCGEPLTDSLGNIRHSPDPQHFRTLTRNDFSVAELRRILSRP